MQPGDIIFYRPTGFIGWSISKLTRSEYSHVALAIDSYNIIEADRFIKSRVSNFYYIDKIHSIYRVADVTFREQELIVDNAMQMLDKSYDYNQLLGIMLRILFHKEYTMFNTANKYICSEIIDMSLLSAGIPRKDHLNLGDITPQELFEKYKLVKVL